MNDEQAKALRAPFPPEAIGKLPRAKNKAAAEAGRKENCAECGRYHVVPAIHLDYVGHAAVTDRLLEVDPAWSWEPMAYGPNGEPLLSNGGLWIKLTVCGVTRPGFGDAERGRGMKECIGDAIRNAAMRFGVALDLWAKEDLQGSLSEGEGQTNSEARAATAETAPSFVEQDPTEPRAFSPSESDLPLVLQTDPRATPSEIAEVRQLALDRNLPVEKFDAHVAQGGVSREWLEKARAKIVRTPVPGFVAPPGAAA